jgi:DNA/RNA endonuclease YhcR with UshA esterase domain
MNTRSMFVLAAGLGWIVAAVPVSAHHSFAAEYDANRPLTVTGTVTKVEWTNPHARVYIDAKDESGKVVHWDFELGPPNGLMRRGWSRNSLKPGHVVTIAGFHSKTDPYIANARTVSLADGRQVFAGSSFDTGPTQEGGVTQ